MPTLFDWNTVSVLRRDRIADAEDYAKQLNKGLSFHAWLHVGDGLIQWRDAAQELAGTQYMDSPAYRSAWAAAKPNYPNLSSIAEDKAVRRYAIWMTENREAIETWYAGLSNKERRNWNHPRTIWNHSPLGKATKAAEEPTRKKAATASTLDLAVGRIESVADQVERSIGGTMAMAFDMAPELIAESARNFVDIYGPEDTARFADELTRSGRPNGHEQAQPKKNGAKHETDEPDHPMDRDRWLAEIAQLWDSAATEWRDEFIGDVLTGRASFNAKHKSAPDKPIENAGAGAPETPQHTMTAREFRATLKRLGTNQRRLATKLQVAVSTVSRWALDHAPVPGYAIAYLDTLISANDAPDKPVENAAPKASPKRRPYGELTALLRKLEIGDSVVVDGERKSIGGSVTNLRKKNFPGREFHTTTIGQPKGSVLITRSA